MSAFRDAFLSRLTQALGGWRPAAADEPAAPDSGGDEFADLLGDLGSSDDGSDDAALRLRDAQISELQQNLAALREVAETLAATERARLAAEARVAELEAQSAEERVTKALERRVVRLESALEKERARADKLRERLDAQREKTAERHRVAAERWHELRRIGRERRTLEDRLRQQELRLDEVAGLLPSLREASGHAGVGVVSRLAALMGEPCRVDGVATAARDASA